MVSAPVVRDRKNAFCDERAELQAILSSPLFQRAPKLSKILAYLCEQYFSGKAADLKEYSIAVDALGRTPEFDPQTDAIVRVDLHLLRRRLERYYAQDGRARRVRILLPPGHYAPEFVANNPACNAGNLVASTHAAPAILEITNNPASAQHPRNSFLTFLAKVKSRILTLAMFPVLLFTNDWIRRRSALAAIFIGLFGFAIGVYGTLMVDHQPASQYQILGGRTIPVKAASLGIQKRSSADTRNNSAGETIRIRCGSNQSFVDTDGLDWSGDLFYSGGTPFLREASQTMSGPDEVIYSTGRRGIFQYDIPVTQGTYEVRLLFWKTTSGENQQSLFSVGSASSDRTKVGDDSSETSILKIYHGVRPGVDGRLHIRSKSAGGFLNALEIIPEMKPDR